MFLPMAAKRSMDLHKKQYYMSNKLISHYVVLTSQCDYVIILTVKHKKDLV